MASGPAVGDAPGRRRVESASRQAADDMSDKKCDRCDRPAVIRETRIRDGVCTEVNLCLEHAQQAGYTQEHPEPQQIAHVVISKKALARDPQVGQVANCCPSCGLSFASFRKQGILGCPSCYDAFERELGPLTGRAQNDATHHVGKTPQRAGGSIDRQAMVRRLLKELEDAVGAEHYERAAELRDELQAVERSKLGQAEAADRQRTGDDPDRR